MRGEYLLWNVDSDFRCRRCEQSRGGCCPRDLRSLLLARGEGTLHCSQWRRMLTPSRHPPTANSPCAPATCTDLYTSVIKMIFLCFELLRGFHLATMNLWICSRFDSKNTHKSMEHISLALQNKSQHCLSVHIDTLFPCRHLSSCSLHVHRCIDRSFHLQIELNVSQRINSLRELMLLSASARWRFLTCSYRRTLATIKKRKSSSLNLNSFFTFPLFLKRLCRFGVN